MNFPSAALFASSEMSLFIISFRLNVTHSFTRNVYRHQHIGLPVRIRGRQNKFINYFKQYYIHFKFSNKV